ncbi:helix-turn-helix domain-containing protein [Pseudomonas putida]|uniref:GlxA family transcriptional regulator n=1 Tax=Pseudomonas putida TaxID=303 RepID=UPI0023637CC2|nr:helix-turn-helix domain-containing protein [Pseudomonas putida]MDD1968972.1 helix-turn-helix domain-containing protein [Pseudomonas putida]
MATSALASFNQPRTVLFLAYPQMGLLDLTGAQTVFWAATKAMNKRGLAGYLRPTASITGGLTLTAEGVEVNSDPLSSLAGSVIDTVIVPGAPDILQALDNNPDTIEWLRTIAPHARRTASVCSGAFLLAQAGLLDAKRVATHWAMCDMLKTRFPTVDVDQDAIFIQQGTVWTSAGVTAGIDLALALVEADCGRDVAMEVARELVVFMKRPGGQSQFSTMLQAQMQDGDVFSDFHLWLTRNLHRAELDVEQLARHANMSVRNFSRVYKLKTGRSPAKALEFFRLEAARRMLEDSDRHIDQVAQECGFGDEERMRVTFHRNLATSPRDYRSRFAR